MIITENWVLLFSHLCGCMNREIEFLILAILEIYNLNRVISHSVFSFLRIFIFTATLSLRRLWYRQKYPNVGELFSTFLQV